MSQTKAVQKAREQARREAGECIVVYRDPDAREFYFCKQEVFESLVDSGQVRAEWITETFCA